MRITVAIVTKPKRNVIYINRLLNSSGYFSHSFLILIQANSLLSDGNECTHIKELKPPAAAFNSFDITRLSFRASVCVRKVYDNFHLLYTFSKLLFAKKH